MNLNINYEETKNIGNQVISKAETFGTYVNKINELNTQVAQVWTGADASKYISTVNQQIAYMRELTQTIDLIGRFLVNVGTEYENAAANNASAIR